MLAKIMIETLTAARAESNLSRTQLSIRMGIDRNSLRGWEVEGSSPRVHNFVDWANSLGYDVQLIKRGNQ